MRAISRPFGFAMLLLLLAVSRSGASATPDLSSPKKATVAFASGLQAGDFEQVKAASLGGETDYKLMQTVASTMSAVHKLHDAASARFGPEEAKKMGTGVNENNDISRQIEASDETVNGDTATILEKGKPESNTIHLKKVDGQWKVDLTNYPQKQVMQQQVPMLDAMRVVMTQSATDVTAGRYKTAEEAGTDMRQRMFTMMAAIAKQSTPQTAPAK